jgi:hypothetical protein
MTETAVTSRVVGGRLYQIDLAEIPEMTRGRGVILQRCRSGGLADAKVFRLADGLSWRQGESRTRTETDLLPWRGARGGAGRGVPQSFPRSGRFRTAPNFPQPAAGWRPRPLFSRNAREGLMITCRNRRRWYWRRTAIPQRARPAPARIGRTARRRGLPRRPARRRRA